LCDDLARLARASTHGDAAGRAAIDIIDLPPDTADPYQPTEDLTAALECRQFTGTIKNDWRVASFSWMTSGRRMEAPDHDADALPAVIEPVSARGIFAFPRGANAGTCLHKIFEAIELTERDPARIEPQVRRQLRAHGIDDTHLPSVVTAVHQTLAAPLGSGPHAFCLNQVPRRARVTELEFCFALNPIDAGDLRRAFARLALPRWAEPWPEQIGQLTFSPTRGYLKGFVDLICERDGRFHLIDWKSNWLGDRLQDYHADALRREMIGRFYVLQYHLYAVALHRHLQLRLPGYRFAQHFGGVHYLFVRGIDPKSAGHGIFSETPTEEHLLKLTETLLAPPPALTP
jgi:exodeoxyribonuclease V beta subunit